jgi:hypothetical protein
MSPDISSDTPGPTGDLAAHECPETCIFRNKELVDALLMLLECNPEQIASLRSKIPCSREEEGVNLLILHAKECKGPGHLDQAA